MDMESSSPMVLTTSPDTFLKLCLLLTAMHPNNLVPKVCRNSMSLASPSASSTYSNADLARIWESLENGDEVDDLRTDQDRFFRPTDLRSRENQSQHHFRYTSRSLSVVGVLGGIVLVLLVIALSTCIKNRRNIIMEESSSGHESFARQILIDHLRHLSSSRQRQQRRDAEDHPPHYDEVVKDEEDGREETQPPSYVEAVAAAAAADDASASSSVDGNHVVTIEIVHGSEDAPASTTASTSRTSRDQEAAAAANIPNTVVCALH